MWKTADFPRKMIYTCWVLVLRMVYDHQPPAMTRYDQIMKPAGDRPHIQPPLCGIGLKSAGSLCRKKIGFLYRRLAHENGKSSGEISGIRPSPNLQKPSPF